MIPFSSTHACFVCHLPCDCGEIDEIECDDCSYCRGTSGSGARVAAPHSPSLSARRDKVFDRLRAAATP